MDPITALGIATAVVTFVDVSAKIVKRLEYVDSRLLTHIVEFNAGIESCHKQVTYQSLFVIYVLGYR
jgi:hypothetical protein